MEYANKYQEYKDARLHFVYASVHVILTHNPLCCGCMSKSVEIL